MSWFKLDDQFPTHPKVLRAGPEAAWLYIAGGCYCAKHSTNGKIPKVAVATLTTLRSHARLAAVLVREELWHDRGDEYEVHDYLAYNPSREEVEKIREQARERRAKGGKRSADVRANASNPDPTPPDVPTEQEDSRGEPYESDFDELWKSYPRKVDRGAAFKAYQARRRDGVTHGCLMAAVIAYADASDGQDRQFVKYGATFLAKNGCWPEWVNGAPLDAIGNGALGITSMPRAPIAPFAPHICAVGNPDCRDGFIDTPQGAKACECRTMKTTA